jgi:uncharacterized integral membrane protein
MNFIKSIFRIIKTVILSLILICLVIFMVDNRDNLTIHLYPLPFEIETKAFLVMIVFFILGMIFGCLLFSKKLLSHTFEGWKDKYKIKKLEKKVK